VGEGELGGVLDPGLEMPQQRADEMVLATEAGQQGQVHIDGFTRLPPTLQGEAADQAEPPALRRAPELKFVGGSDDLKHGRRLS
jgi:hypothetical protein